MNGRKAKAIRKQAKELQVEWLKSLVTNEDSIDEPITIENVHEYMPEQTHYISQGQIRMSAFTLKWITKKLKRNNKIKNYKELEYG
tara:strand:- start:606 stop:863 length:258 start_codon:yes stop_codon:yes gene_type:complete